MGARRARVFTIGYGGRTIDSFIEALTVAGVGRVVDVRELPLSRKRGFSKTALRTALAGAGIDYVHVRSAGNPYRTQRADVARCLRLYRRHLARHVDVVDELARVAAERPAALLCAEADHACCHRSIIADSIIERHRFVVHHL